MLDSRDKLIDAHMYKKIPEKAREEIISKIRSEGMSVQQASDLFGVSTKAIYSWLDKGLTPSSVSLLQYNRLRRENTELYEIVGRLTMEKQKGGKKRGGN